MYMAVATPHSRMPPTRNAIRTHNADGVGSAAIDRSRPTPITTTLEMVPIPGRWRSGIHSSSTTTLAMMRAVPTDSPVRRARPWWNTSHGMLPRRDSIMRAMLTAYADRPR
jgi:hypothetical protein